MATNSQLTELELTLERIREERENKREIFEAIHDGIIVFKPSLSIQNINSQAKKLLSIEANFDPAKDYLSLYKNKKTTLMFKLDTWLECIKNTNKQEPTEILVWYSDPLNLQSTPLLFSAKAMFNKNGELKNILLVIYDRSIHNEADEQKRLMQAAFNSYNGQFIANEKGYIIKSNDSFIAISGLSREALQKMTLMQWLEQQVNLKNDSNGILKSLLENKLWSGEVELHPSQDTVFHAILSISMIADKEYNIEHYIVNLQNITDIKEAHNRIEHMAFYDNLTGLANRKLAKEYITYTITNHRRHNTYGALLYININRFKTINNAFGRRVADRFLQLIAAELNKTVNIEDQIARVGGDEFLITCIDHAKSADNAAKNALKMAKKIAKALNRHFLVDGLSLHSTSRIGIKPYPDEEDTSADNLIVKADLAVSKAKEIKTNNPIYIYTPDLSSAVKSRKQLEQDLGFACQKNQVQLYYQAQMNSNQELHGAETLIRWFHPELGMISPDIFIEIAEESQQILKLGAWIMYHAFKQIKRWNKLKRDFKLSINISPIQFHDADFIPNIISIKQETGVNPKNITLELTEGILISDTEQALHKIDQLVELGFKVSIDDFGTGYSSLSYFQRLPIHELKIDKSFVSRIPKSKEDIAIIESIVHLANTKKLDIVAEGVETAEQLNFIQKQSANILVQGYYYSKPCPAQEFENQFLIK
ncbi:EAL domain-containing protein [Thiomicrorhabdus sp. Milos-T2]|uniref:sensor domain-containing protein n=1 Tax=Thiomicrorhabdus sp. Milos-T2 TaxID=90814 RepID=UPI00068F043E|nr:EAL domain-containing protein [Thiomicrorhabdus sp. Milos-T2]